jgi:hypothetical protein
LNIPNIPPVPAFVNAQHSRGCDRKRKESDSRDDCIKIRDEAGKVVRGMCRAPEARRIFYKCTICPHYFPALEGYCDEEETKACRECRRGR